MGAQNQKMSLIQWTIVETPFCFANISFPFNCTDLVLYSKFPYGSQFSAEKNGLKFRCLVLEICCKNHFLILLDILYFYDFPRFRLKFFKSIVRKKFPINLFTVFFSCSHFSNRKRTTYQNLHATGCFKKNVRMFLALYLEQYESYKNGFYIAGKRKSSCLFLIWKVSVQ